VAARIAHSVRPAAPGKGSDASRDPGPHDTPRRPAPPRVLPDQGPRRPDGVRWLTQPARSPPRRRTRPRSSGGSRTRSPRTPRLRPNRPHPTTTRPFQGSTSPLTERPPGRRHQRPTSPVTGPAVLRPLETSGGAARRRRINARFAAESPARTGFLTSGALVAPQVQQWMLENSERVASCSAVGGGSRATVAITVLVKNPGRRGPAAVRYVDVGDYVSRDDQLKKVAEAGGMTALCGGPAACRYSPRCCDSAEV
jgi:hypothetical protein